MEVVALIGGHFDSQGNWLPDSQAYLRLQVNRQRPGATFWLKDNQNGQFSPRNQTGLVDALWRDPGVFSSTPLQFFALPGERWEHEFALFEPMSGAMVLASKGALQGYYNEANEWGSYNFFEAWVPRISTPDPLQLVDLTTNEMVPNPEPNLVAALWQPVPAAQIPTVNVVFILPDGEGSTFNLYVENAGPQQLYPSQSAFYDSQTGNYYYNTYFVSASVGRLSRFWLERISDGARVGPFRLYDQDQIFDVRSSFPEVPPYQPNWSYQYFHFGSSHSPWSACIRHANGLTSSFNVNWSNTYYYWDSNGNSSSYTVYEAYAWVDVAQNWWVEENGSSLGQGPNFDAGFSGETFYPPDGSYGLYFPSARGGHALKLVSGATWPLIDQGNCYSTGGYFGPNGEWVEWIMNWGTASTTGFQWGSSMTLTLADDSSGDFINFPGNDFSSVTTWFPIQSVVLKLSATRWGHDLRIRTGSGAEYSINPQKVQGDWSLDANGRAWFNGYGFFDATAQIQVGVPWWILDYSRIGQNGVPEILSADTEGSLNFIGATDPTDSDQDGWADWYERVVGTDPNNPDTDGDGIIDSQDPNPRSQLVGPTSTLKVWTPLQ